MNDELLYLKVQKKMSFKLFTLTIYDKILMPLEKNNFLKIVY